MLWLGLIVVKLIKQKQGLSLGAFFVIGKYVHIISRFALAVEFASGNVIERQ